MAIKTIHVDRKEVRSLRLLVGFVNFLTLEFIQICDLVGCRLPYLERLWCQPSFIALGYQVGSAVTLIQGQGSAA